MPTIQPEYLVIGGLLVVAIALAAWIVRLEKRLRRLMRGKDAESLEETIAGVMKDIATLKRFRHDSTEYLREVENRLQRNVGHIETLRFNPFQGTGEGGNQSFATAFVNEQGHGVVITSLHVRDRVSVFAKPVKNFESENELTDEERHVIAKALETLSGDKGKQ